MTPINFVLYRWLYVFKYGPNRLFNALLVDAKTVDTYTSAMIWARRRGPIVIEWRSSA